MLRISSSEIKSKFVPFLDLISVLDRAFGLDAVWSAEKLSTILDESFVCIFRRELWIRKGKQIAEKSVILKKKIQWRITDGCRLYDFLICLYRWFLQGEIRFSNVSNSPIEPLIRNRAKSAMFFSRLSIDFVTTIDRLLNAASQCRCRPLLRSIGGV